MMKHLFVILFVLLSFSRAIAQEHEVIKVNTIDDKEDFVKQIYKYQYFIDGRAFVRGEGPITAKFNYNRLSDAICFLNDRGDTLRLGAPEKTDGILINKDLFYYFDKGYVQKISNYDKINLAVKSRIKQTATESRGAFGSYSTTNNSQSLRDLNDDKNTRLRIDQNRVYAIDNQYFFVDLDHKVYPASKRNLITLLPTHKAELIDFLNKNNINFKNSASLQKLLEYAQTLSNS